MYVWNSSLSAFEAVNRIFVGYAIANLSNITSVTYYSGTEESSAIDAAILELSGTLTDRITSLSSTTETLFNTATADAHLYTETQIHSALVLSAYPYTDAALQSAKNYADEVAGNASSDSASAIHDALTLSAYPYTDTQIHSALMLSAYPYTDTQIHSALELSAYPYTDLQISSVYLSAQTYADNSAKKYALIFG